MAAASKTRVCIKNLPPTASAQDVKEFLKEQASTIEITDCKVLKNAKGKSRKVAFVGFKQESDASLVVERFHRTYMRMSRISVEPALAKKEEEKKEETSHNSSASKQGESTSAKSDTKDTKDSLTSKHKQEIMELLGDSGKKSKFWANDGDVPVSEEATAKAGTAVSGDDSNGDSETDSTSSSDEDSDDDSDSDESAADEKEESAPKSAISDMDFLRSKQKSTGDLEEEADDDDNKNNYAAVAPQDTLDKDSSSSSDSDSSDSDSSDSETEESPQQPRQAPATNTDPGPDTVMEDTDDKDDEAEAKKEEVSQSRLFVRNLPFGATEEELEEYFSTYGALVECHIPVDDQKRNKGFAFVQYASAVDALAARKDLDKVDFQGRLLHILPARPALAAPKAGTENLSWKQRQELARKEQDTKASGDGAKGWSASFVRGDAVVDNLADRLGLRKGDLLGVKDKLSSGDAAVRLALGETKIIEENREYFQEHGIDMEALVSARGEDKQAKRSKTAILVKNLPYDTRVEELNKLFQLGEENINILLPPSRTIALVEYGHSTDAKRAFRKLAYRRFKHVPIYLEWAPEAARTSSGRVQDSGSAAAKDSETPSVPTKDMRDDDEHEVDAHSGTGSTIYVKNLNFVTNEDTVRQTFEKHVGKVLSVRIPQKVAPARSGEEPQLLSMGYGFVELESESAARTAIQKLQGKMVEGHAWEVTVSSNKKSASRGSKPLTSGKNATKLIVRNVPFQATRKELLKLFGTFGQLRRVRLPKKFDGTHRGFAFVEFLTGKEALAAMNALSRTHLYGRHLVLEWATDADQDVDRLREKAKRDAGTISTSSKPQNKKIKFT